MNDLRPQAWTSPSKCHGNNISYAEALNCLAIIAIRQKALLDGRKRIGVKTPTKTVLPRSNDRIADRCIYENIAVLAANGRVCAHRVLSPCSTPATDTSAMDGYAIMSASTVSACPERPVKFRIAGTIAAGADVSNNQNLTVNQKSFTASDNPCVEIMTGACFPDQHFPQLDAVVKVEDVEIVEEGVSNGRSAAKHILVSSPVRARQHRRPAGSDFQMGDSIITKGTKIEPKHIMALTSVGISSISVETESGWGTNFVAPEAEHMLKIGVLPTGSELLNLFDAKSDALASRDCGQRFPDSNGPYITSAVQSMSPSFKADYIGPCPDDEYSLVKALNKAVKIQQYDVLVTSGGVSMGRFDLVRKVIETRLGAEIIFHGCSVRPGAPVLFGIINQRTDNHHSSEAGMTAFFGAPGNPLAAAMTIRFFLRPYLKMLRAPRTSSVDELIQTALSDSVPVQVCVRNQTRMHRKPSRFDAFLLAKHRESTDIDGQVGDSVDLLEDQASYKIKPFLQADCWVTAAAGNDRILDGEHTRSNSLW